MAENPSPHQRSEGMKPRTITTLPWQGYKALEDQKKTVILKEKQRFTRVIQ
jgi:hypothetical protein